MGRVAKRIVSGLVSIAVVVGGIYVIANRHAVRDWIVTRNYQPTTQIAGLVDRAGLSSAGRRILYASRPQVDDKASFNNDCPITEKSLVLGCYADGRIYILKVDEPRLAGVEEVTTAHEMLHAAYARLPSKEREAIDKLVQAQYAKTSDERIKSLVDGYMRDDAASVPNELHSILGTEVKDLEPELEAHYRKYFTDRALVIHLSDQYESVFAELQKKVALYDSQIESLKAQIDIQQGLLEQQRAQLDTLRAAMDEDLNQQRYSEYNSQVPTYNSKVRTFNTGVAKLEDLIKQYNSIVKERNDIVVTQKELTQKIDSKYQPLQSK